MGSKRDAWKRAIEQVTGGGAGGERARRPDIQVSRRPKGIVDAVREASEQSAKKVLTDAFDERRSDLEEMAVNALRRAIEEEGDRLERLIEKSIEVKKREVRLSLLVLLVATSVYVVLALTLG